MTARVLEADLTWTGETFDPGIRVTIDGDWITAVGPGGPPPSERLAGRALLPGFINAHSHAFQRGLRGRGELFPGDGGSFWTWREAMYELVTVMDEPTFSALCRQAFREMLQAGTTTVGEFHYFHHAPGDAAYTYDDLVLAAAREAGIRIVLLNAYYRSGGTGRPLNAAQQRFSTPTVDGFWEHVDALAVRMDDPRQRLGVVAHSIRAVPPDDLAALHDGAITRTMPIHMHLEEQPGEIEECRAAYGATPTQVLLDALGGSTRIVGVHCTHTTDPDMRDFLAAGGTACICPLTEANLGDGIPGLKRLGAAENAISLGTDSNARISMLEEMRWLEYGQRWKSGSRGVLTNGLGDAAARLLQIATQGGARALGLPAGVIAPNHYADFVTCNLNAPALALATADTLAAALVFGAGNSALADVCVGGKWVGV